MRMFFHSCDAPAERAADPEVGRANLNRIHSARLFGVAVPPSRVRSLIAEV
jgi:hypothetical protein